jgi:hypothetical protein
VHADASKTDVNAAERNGTIVEQNPLVKIVDLWVENRKQTNEKNSRDAAMSAYSSRRHLSSALRLHPCMLAS